jgi:hypothetical protein
MQNYSYYPWNTGALVEWLKQELVYRDQRNLEASLNIPRHRFQAWLREPMPTITLAHLRAIAQYRGWSLSQTIDWLELQPVHVNDLMNADASECR